MSKETISRTSLYEGNGEKIAIVASRYNEKYADALVENCRDEIGKITRGVNVEVVRVPGAFEIPMMVNFLLHGTRGEKTPDAVIALGVILRGSTAHADLIGEAITRELLHTACHSLTPVIHEVLLLQNEEQAQERCLGEQLNRGKEAARAAVEMMRLTVDHTSY